MLHLTKRTRPDILVATHFLSTRVQKPTEADAEKVYHCLRYLNGTKDLRLRLNAFDPVHVIQYVDAAHAVHENMRSHAGSMSTLSLGAIDAGSTALDMNTKSACESDMFHYQIMQLMQSLCVIFSLPKDMTNTLQ